MRSLSLKSLGASATMTPALQRRLVFLGAGLAVSALGAAYSFLAGDDDTATLAEPAPAVAVAPDGMTKTAAAPATVASAPAPAAARPDSLPAERTDTVRILRELFGYAAGGRRDPYRPLISTNALRPLPSELRLTAVAFDPAGVQSVAILRDITTQEQHRVRQGQVLGRMRILRIRPKAIVFAIEELGYSRTSELTLPDSNVTRPQP